MVFESSTLPSGAVRSSVLSPLKTPISPLVFHCRESGAVTTMLRAPTFNVIVRATPGGVEKVKPLQVIPQFKSNRHNNVSSKLGSDIFNRFLDTFRMNSMK